MRMATANNKCTRTHIAYMGLERCMNYVWVGDKKITSRAREEKRWIPLRWLVI